MRTTRIMLALLAAAGGLVLLGAAPAAACSCVQGTPARYVRWADVVFTGRVTGIEEGVRGGSVNRYTFEVARVFEGRGRLGTTAVVTSGSQSSACGLEGIRLDQDYVVFAGAGRDGLGASSCGGTTRASSALEAAVERQVRRPPAPVATVGAVDVGLVTAFAAFVGSLVGLSP